MNGLPAEFKVDTGADVSVIPSGLYRSLKPDPSLSRTTRPLMGPCKQKLSCLGTFMAELRVHDKVAKVYVIEDLERPLLGRKPAKLLKLMSRLDSLSSDDFKSKVADKYLKLFKGLGVMKDSYCITLKLLYHLSKCQCQGECPSPCIRKQKKS